MDGEISGEGRRSGDVEEVVQGMLGKMSREERRRMLREKEGKILRDLEETAAVQRKEVEALEAKLRESKRRLSLTEQAIQGFVQFPDKADPHQTKQSSAAQGTAQDGGQHAANNLDSHPSRSPGRAPRSGAIPEARGQIDERNQRFGGGHDFPPPPLKKVKQEHAEGSAQPAATAAAGSPGKTKFGSSSQRPPLVIPPLDPEASAGAKESQPGQRASSATASAARSAPPGRSPAARIHGDAPRAAAQVNGDLPEQRSGTHVSGKIEKDEEAFGADRNTASSQRGRQGEWGKDRLGGMGAAAAAATTAAFRQEQQQRQRHVAGPDRAGEKRAGAEQRVGPTNRGRGAAAAAVGAPFPSLQQSVDLISSICSASSAHLPHFLPSTLLPSGHKRKLRSLILNPQCPSQCAISSLDCDVSFWDIAPGGRKLNSRFMLDAAVSKLLLQDMAWSLDGSQIAVTYSAGTQVALLGNQARAKCEPLPNTPHAKGAVHCVAFMPWQAAAETSSFATGGADHAAVLWSRREGGQYLTTPLHREYHTSAIFGISACLGRQALLTAGADKRVFGFDLERHKLCFSATLDSKAISVTPNPVDFNLLLVYSGSHGQQMKLFDFRSKHASNPKPLHSFGFEQKTSEQQTALISPCWSPNGLFCAVGSVDSTIHVHDIRFISPNPGLSIHAHEKRVFKAVWHPTMSMMLSISSDLNVGLHCIRG